MCTPRGWSCSRSSLCSLLKPYSGEDLGHVLVWVAKGKNVLDKAIQRAAEDPHRGPLMELREGQEAVLRHCLAYEPRHRPTAEDVFLALGGRLDGVAAAEAAERKRSFLRSCDWCLRRARGEGDMPPEPGQTGDLSEERAPELANTLRC